MKEYCVKYKLSGTGYLKVMADSEEEAMNEIENVFTGDPPENEENSWIDQEVVWDLEWDCETIDATEED